jgi:hypothetical protein
VPQGRAQAQEIPDGTRLTQFGEQPPVGAGFRDRLRTDIGETEISLILGEVDATAASMLVTKQLLPTGIRRVTDAGRLRRAQFTVVHSPTKGNPLHVSVFGPVSAASAGEAEWGSELARRFNACFTEGDSTRRRWLSMVRLRPGGRRQ